MNQPCPHAHLRAAFTAGCRIQAWHLNDGAAHSNDGRWDTLTPTEGREPEFGCAPHLYRVHPEDLSLIAELGQEVGAVADGAALLVRDVCEMDQADPDAPDTVCIRVSDLTRIAELYTSPAHTSEARDSRLAELFDAASKGFHISETCGPDKKYWRVSKFQTMAELHAYEDAWRAAMTQARDERAKA